MSRRPHRGYSPSSSGLPLSVCGPAPGTRFPRSVPGACFAVPLVPALRSSGSAASRPALFVGLSATMADLTFHVRLSSATALRLPDADQRPVTNRLNADLPVPVQRASTHARFFDHAGSSRHSRLRACLNRLAPSQWCRHPGHVSLRGSMAGLCAPLPTLRCRPLERPRTAQGRCGSLLLHRTGLAPTTRCRSPGALRKTLDAFRFYIGFYIAQPPSPGSSLAGFSVNQHRSPLPPTINASTVFRFWPAGVA